MSNYFYKSINLNQIYQNNGTTYGAGTPYVGMPTRTDPSGNVNFSGMRPLTFGYTTNTDGDLSNIAVANLTIINTSTTTPSAIPTGAKQIRWICVGGGGGGGGAGGFGRANVNNTATGNGGVGGTGGFGVNTAVTGSYNLQNVNSYGITIGAGGTGGTKGANRTVNNVTGKANAVGSSGNDGNAGGPTSLYVFTNASPNVQQIIATASGGNGGGGGAGGSANADSSGNTNSSTGAAGTSGTPAAFTSLSPVYPTPSVGSTSPGNPGTGDIDNSNGTTLTAPSGRAGQVTIIWLYD